MAKQTADELNHKRGSKQRIDQIARAEGTQRPHRRTLRPKIQRINTQR